MKANIYVTRRIPQPALDMLTDLNTEISPFDRVLERKELLEFIKGRDGILSQLTDKVDDEFFEAAGPQLKIVANYAVGYNNIDVDAATRHGVIITNTPGVLTDTTADLAWTLIMSVGRRIVEADRFMRAGKYKGWAPMLFLGGDIHHKTLGIIGMGRIGQAVARRATGFGMKVIYSDAQPISKDLEKELNATYMSKEEVLKNADFLSLHVPLMPETTHMISDKEFDMMKSTAYLINSSRGPVVDEKALVKALQDKKIAGAGLDVYENEPEMAEGMAELDNITIVPHIASASIATRTKMGTMAAENIVAYFKGEVPPNMVNPEVFKKA